MAGEMHYSNVYDHKEALQAKIVDLEKAIV